MFFSVWRLAFLLLLSIRFAATGWAVGFIPSQRRAASNIPLFVTNEVESVEIPDDVDLDLSWFEEELVDQAKPTIPNRTLTTLLSPPDNCQLGPPSSSGHVIGQWFDVIALAYIGDALLELFVRSRKVTVTATTDEVRRQVYSFVRKGNQANLLAKLEDNFFLSEPELVLVETGRFHGSAVTLEALIGYTYTTDKRRYQELMSWLSVYVENSVEDDDLHVHTKSLESVLFPQPDCDADDLSPTSLAYIGDAFFELFVRFQKIWPPRAVGIRLHDVACLVRPLHQSKLLEKLRESFPLTDRENSIIETMLLSSPGTEYLTRSKDPEMFAAASALEALIGYTYMKDKNRCEELMNWITVYLERVESLEDSIPNRTLEALLLPPPDCPLGPPSWASVGDPTSFDTTSWMMIGDAVQELLLRCRTTVRLGGNLRKRLVTVSNTQHHQSKLFTKLQESFPLTKLEEALVEKAQRSVLPKKKNRKPTKGHKGYSKDAHAASTALRALIGFTYMSNENRCQELLNWLAYSFDRVDKEYETGTAPQTPLRRLLLPKIEAYDITPASLAYIGDALYGLFVRCHVLWPYRSVDRRMNAVNHFVCAEHQSLLMDKLYETFDLSDIERAFVKEARDAGHATRDLHPKICADSTALEALIGYTYVDNQERCRDLLNWIAFHLERV